MTPPMKTECEKCTGKGWYSYDHNHGKLCEVCCKHDKGFWMLEEHYGNDNGKFCCRAGCGFTKSELNYEDLKVNAGILEPKAQKQLKEAIFEAKEGWEEEFDSLLDTFNIERREPTYGEMKVESAVKSFIRKTLATQRSDILERIGKMKDGDECGGGSNSCGPIMYNQAVDDILEAIEREI